MAVAETASYCDKTSCGHVCGCVWVCVGCFLTFLGVCGCVWVCVGVCGGFSRALRVVTGPEKLDLQYLNND